MITYTLLLSRIVPILFWLSFCLVIARVAKDFFNRRGQQFAARIVFPAILVFGIVAAVPACQRLWAVVTGERAFAARNWPVAATRLDLFRRLGGRMSPRFETHLAMSLLNLRLWKEAEELVASSAQRDSDTLTLLGISRYYAGDLGGARNALASARDDGSAASMRHYFLGRAMERGGDLAGALREYGIALRMNPSFFPAAYQRIRLLQRADPRQIPPTIAAARDAFFERDAELKAIRESLGVGRPLPEREFYVILP